MAELIKVRECRNFMTQMEDKLRDEIQDGDRAVHGRVDKLLFIQIGNLAAAVLTLVSVLAAVVLKVM